MRLAELVPTFLPPLPRDHWRRVTDGLHPEHDVEEISQIVAQHEFPSDVRRYAG